MILGREMINIQKLRTYVNEDVVDKYATEFKLPRDTAAAHFNQLKYFLRRCSMSDQPQTPTRDIDNIWHTFLLFTSDYAEFCGVFFGKFIHHKPDRKIRNRNIISEGGVYCEGGDSSGSGGSCRGAGGDDD